ncbi:ABC transporter substrate-binding protein [Geoglobus ahangari]
MRQRYFALIVLVLAIVLAGCAQKEASSADNAGMATITDLMGREVHVKVPVERVVITFNVEEYVAVGGEDALKKVVGWSKYYWEGRRPTVWNAYLQKYPWIDEIPDVGYPWKGTFSAEKVIELKPDVVIMSKDQYKYVKEDLEKLEKAGIPVVFIDYYEPFNVTTHSKSTMLLGILLGKEKRAKELVEYYKSQVDEVLKRLKKVEDRPKVLLLGKGWTTYGRDHYRGKMIEFAGGENIAAKVVEKSGEISPEYVLEENPDVVIFIGKKGWNVDLGYGIEREKAEEMLRELINRPGWENLNAVKNGRVYAIHIYFVHGHIYDFVALQYFAKWLHPELFSDLDPEKSWEEFHEKFLPVKYSGTWAVSLESPKAERVIKVTDLAGRTVEVKVPVSRVVLLYGLEDYAAVGGEEALNKLVGLNSWRYKKYRPDWWQGWIENYPWLAELPDVGQPGKTFEVEQVLKLNPDVVIADRSMLKYMDEDLKRLEKAGIPVVFTDYFPHSSNVTELFDEVNRSTMLLGTLLGKEERARELVQFFREQVSSVVEKAQDAENRPKAIVFATWSEWRAYGKEGMYNHWIDMAGGRNIAAEVVSGASGDVNPEFVLEQNPDVIVFTCNNNFPSGQRVAIGYTVDSDAEAKAALRELINRPGWENLNAVKNGRVYIVHHGLSHGHIFEFACLQYIAKWLHPELFGNLNPEGSLKEFYERFMPLPYRGVWATSIGG